VRIIWILLLFCFSCQKDIDNIKNPIKMATYYVATTGSDSSGTGTIGNPWKSWQKGFSSLTAGDTLYIRGGTYTDMYGNSGSNDYGVFIDSFNGTSGSHITVSNYAAEVPILDGSSLTSTTHWIMGIRLLDCSFWDLTGLIVINFKQNADSQYNAEGIYQDACHDMKWTRCVAHDNGDGITMWNGMDNTTFINCDSYQNHDRFIGQGDETPGGLANGFYGAVGEGETVTFIGCRSWSNSDDGWDLYNGAGTVTWINCWAFSNADGYGGVTGDGSGFKMGPIVADEGGYQRKFYNCLAFYNVIGFDQNQATSPYVPKLLMNCVSYHNQSYNFQFYTESGSLIRNCISFGGGDPDEFGDSSQDHNSWQNGLSATTADFKSVVISLAKGARQSNGNLPIIDLLHLTTGSDLIGVASTTDMYATDGDGHAWATPPSIGAFEYGETENIPVTAVTVTGAGNATTITVDNGTLQMSAHIDPHDATDQTVVWSVVNGTGRASINQSGLLTAIDNGTVTVKATSNG
jgi:hypothetical protein